MKNVVSRIFVLSLSFMTHAQSTSAQAVNIDNILNFFQQQWTPGMENSTNLGLYKTILGVIHNVTSPYELNKIGQKCFFCSTPSKIAHESIPIAFNCALKWADCADIILRIPKLFIPSCVTAWAVAMTSVLTDRLCISSGAAKTTELSPIDVIQCCEDCASNGIDNCKEGGDGLSAWAYWINSGIVSGSLTNRTGCKPYSSNIETTTCITVCKSRSYDLSLGGISSDRVTDLLRARYITERNKYKFGEKAYLLPNDQTRIQVEILTNGPVQAGIELYEDFLGYTSGIYRHVSGKLLGYHSMKIIGWGVDAANGTNTPFWIVVNVWGSQFGENGTMRFLRGENHCGIEKNVIGAEHKKKKTIEKKGKPKKRPSPIRARFNSSDNTVANFFIVFTLFMEYILARIVN